MSISANLKPPKSSPAQRPQSEWTWQWSFLQDDEGQSEKLFWQWLWPLGSADLAGKKVLDAGCGGGHMLSYIQPLVREGVGVDLNTAAIVQRRFDGALRARQRKRQRSCRPAKPEILADRKKENREAKLMQPAADDANERHQSDHAPAIKYAREKMRRRFEIHGARKLQRRRYVKDRWGVKGRATKGKIKLKNLPPSFSETIDTDLIVISTVGRNLSFDLIEELS